MCDPSIYTIDNPVFIVYSLIEDSIGLKRVNLFLSEANNQLKRQ